MISKVSAIKAFLSMQHPAHTPAINPSTLDIQVLSIIHPDQCDHHHGHHDDDQQPG